MRSTDKVNGVFNADAHIFGRNLYFLFGFLLIAIFLFWFGFDDFFRDVSEWKRSKNAYPDSTLLSISGISTLLFSLILPIAGGATGILVVVALLRSSSKKASELTGIRIMDTGFQLGTISVPEKSIRPKKIWRNRNSGDFCDWKWKPLGEPLNEADLSIIVFLIINTEMQFFLPSKIFIVSKSKILEKLPIESNNFTGIINNHFEQLTITVRENNIDHVITFLENINLILTNCSSFDNMKFSLVLYSGDSVKQSESIFESNAEDKLAETSQENGEIWSRISDRYRIKPNNKEKLESFINKYSWHLRVI